MTAWRSKLRSLVSNFASQLIGRDVIILPTRGEYASNGRVAILPLRYSYRACAEGSVTYQMICGGTNLHYQLFTATSANNQPAVGVEVMSFNIPAIERGETLRVSLLEPSAWLNDVRLQPVVHSHKRGRKFFARFQLVNDSHKLTRFCSHYLPFTEKSVGEDYYFGDDYVDYPSQVDASGAVQLLQRFCRSGRLLDIGCALGIYTKAFCDAGFDAYGVDTSEFAIADAAKRVGQERVRRCDLDSAEIPFDGKFDILWMWDVLEHFHDPRRAIERLTALAEPNAFLFIHTSNSDSLTHQLFGQDWEGFADYSHHGVDQVSATSVSAWLAQTGWKIVHWDCYDVWTWGLDPTIVRLRDVFRRLPELRALFTERNLGDMMLIVAKRA